MAGMKGRSGGARPNSGGARPNAGGARPGAGRPRTPTAPTDERDPLQFLLDVMQGRLEASPTQVRAAVAAAQYVHTKKHDGGKREELAAAAKTAAKGRFKPATPPLALVKKEK